MDDGRTRLFVYLVLASVVKNLLKAKFPHVSLVVDDAEGLILVLLERNGALLQVNIDVFACKVGRRTRPNHHFHSLLCGHLSA